MPDNEEEEQTEEENESETGVAPAEVETEDWTDVITLSNQSQVTMYSREEMAPTSVPFNIPYLEVYRTDELYYQPYTSPFLSSVTNATTEDGEGSSEGDDSSGGGTGGGTGTALWTDIVTIVQKYITVSSGNVDQYTNRLVKADTNWTAIAKITNGHKIKGGVTQNWVIQQILNAKKKKRTSSSSGSSSGKGSSSPKYSAKNKTKYLKQALKETLKLYYKKGTNWDRLVQRYINAKNNRIAIAVVNGRSEGNLKDSVRKDSKKIKEMTTSILSIKKEYS